MPPKYLIMIILITSFDMITGMQVILQGMYCQFEESLCISEICFLKPLRKTLSSINIGCEFREAQNNIQVKIVLYKKAGNIYRKWLLDIDEDFCAVVGGGKQSMFFSRMSANLKKYGNFLRECPLLGNTSLTKYPLDFSFVPSIIPTGKYRANVTLVNLKLNKAFVNITVDYTIS